MSEVMMFEAGSSTAVRSEVHHVPGQVVLAVVEVLYCVSLLQRYIFPGALNQRGSVVSQSLRARSLYEVRYLLSSSLFTEYLHQFQSVL